jgi:hypothetical protein
LIKQQRRTTAFGVEIGDRPDLEFRA